jgi:hypothetical protein
MYDAIVIGARAAAELESWSELGATDFASPAST